MLNTAIQPDGEFLQAARLLRDILERSESRSRGAERKAAEELLRRKFESAFRLSRDYYNVTARLCERIENDERWGKADFFDHPTFYRSGGDYVIVFQCYDLENTTVDEWTRKTGFEAFISQQWSYHYPGKTSLVLIRITPAQKLEMEKPIKHSWRHESATA